jgi:hypothetical protein
MLDGFPKQILVHRAEYLFGQLERSHFLARQVQHINGSHFVSFAGPASSAALQLPSVNVRPRKVSWSSGDPHPPYLAECGNIVN